MVGHPLKGGSIVGKGLMQGWLGLATCQSGGGKYKRNMRKRPMKMRQKGRVSYMSLSRKYVWGALGS